MDKMIKDGKVAVLYSPGYGAGWYSWENKEGLLFDPVIVQMVLNDKHDDITEYCIEKYGSGYYGGYDQLEVEWLPVGTAFRITEYDGYESIQLKEDDVWVVA
jgi:hypothetical protein